MNRTLGAAALAECPNVVLTLSVHMEPVRHGSLLDARDRLFDRRPCGDLFACVDRHVGRLEISDKWRAYLAIDH
jgi:hypothetical protein